MKLHDVWHHLTALLRRGRRAHPVPLADPAPAETAHLLARARAGERTAFDQLVHAWYPAGRRLAASLAGERAADDVLVEAFTDVWHGLEAIETSRQLQLCVATAVGHHAGRLAAAAH